ncbi:glycoside hydrolase family 25 protein [Dyadobacter aurulentus]|uniref:glycoside hydrolase family 25 protein n=1 Tax=Dyadobacter sp. UC 10 TaxID=2605428 RepID=UPI0011F3CD06|nr:GH25 family lysozyme [Dyadobacter sp. UC 10]KAA0991734.1 glycoside hydrolase [Dyadobacter sp. UC 10]
MAKRKIKASTKKTAYLKPLPPKGWAIVAGVVLLIAAVIWWRDSKDENQWEFVSKFGIRLPMRYSIHGIDVSHHNAKINWDKLKKTRSGDVGIDFVYIKATEGATHLDKQFRRNWNEAKRVGMKRGAYHFYNPRVMSDRQVQNFIGQVAMEAGDMPPVLDLETHAGRPDDIIIKGVKNWLTQIEKHYGVRPIIYVNEYFYKKYIAGNFDDYPLWLAGYSRDDISDLALDAKVLFWQHSEKGWADGIKGFVDYNVFLHEGDDWASLGE